MRRAWWSLALFPVAFVAAFVIGEGLFAWLDDGVGDAAIWVIAVSGLPAIIAGTLVAAFVGINLLSFIAMVIFG